MDDKITLANLDIFLLLRLQSLSEEEKQKYLQELTSLAVGQLVIEDLSQKLSEEQQKKATELLQDPQKAAEGIDYLKSIVPEFDELFQKQIMKLKRGAVKANVGERLAINLQQRDYLRSLPADEETNKKVLTNEQERTNLEKTLAAIDADDWATVSSLIPS